MDFEITDELDELMVEDPIKDEDGHDVDPATLEDDPSDKELDEIRSNLEKSYAAAHKEDPAYEPKPLQFEDKNFLEGIDNIDKIFESPQSFNSFLNKIYQKAVADGHKFAMDSFSEIAPHIMNGQINKSISHYDMTRNFYAENKDLAKYTNTVAQIAKKVAEKYPQKNANEVLQTTAKLARKHLKLPEPVIDGSKDKVPRKAATPKFPRRPGAAVRGKGSSEKLEGIDKQIDEMLQVS